MKQQEQGSTTVSTHITDLAAIGHELSDAHLRLASGGAIKKCTYEKTWVNCCAYRYDCNVD